MNIRNSLIIYFLSISFGCATAQTPNYKYNVLEISLEDKIASAEIRAYINEVFKNELNSMNEEGGVPDVYIYEETEGIRSYYVGFLMHTYQVTDRPPNFYTRLNNEIVLLHTTRTSYLNEDKVNWESILPMIRNKLYDEPTLSYHPKIWLIKTQNGKLLEKRILEYFNHNDH